jgi:hypothetical protein
VIAPTGIVRIDEKRPDEAEERSLAEWRPEWNATDPAFGQATL